MPRGLPGFTITTAAHDEFLRENELPSRIRTLVDGLDHEDAPVLESVTQAVRDLIVGADLPAALATEIDAAYAALGESALVAVRSSGTAEDLAEASFAGLHDTYLNVRGAGALRDAVRRCWASMWTARAAAYRRRAGFDHDAGRVAVVVQRMVASEVSGVLFTANPVSARTDEMVVNASWGLGEGVVSGILTPDEFVVSTSTLAVKKATTGSKEVQVVRDPDTGTGTVTVPVPASLRRVRCLVDEQVSELAELGRRVTAFHGGLPQDVEWALADGAFLLLQSRPITGVDFTWDEDVDGWYPFPEDENTVWTFTWAEQFLTGGITPLFYSCRAWECYSNWSRFAKIYGFDDLTRVRWFKYRRATAYYNADAERKWQRGLWPAPLRDLTNIPPAWQDEFAKESTSVFDLARLWARIHVLEPKFGVLRWFDTTYEWIDHRIEEANGPSPEALRRLSDDALKKQIDDSVRLVDEFFATLWPGFFWMAGGSFGTLGWMLAQWYDGSYPGVFQDLISGIGDTALSRETRDMWRLADEIRASERLRAALAEHEVRRSSRPSRGSTRGVRSSAVTASSCGTTATADTRTATSTTCAAWRIRVSTTRASAR